MTTDLLQRIQELQYQDKREAENMLLAFIRDTFALNVKAVELRPLAVSLNSFNGFLTLDDGKRLFFKTHTEPDNVIGEYYNAAQLAEAGYPIIQPMMSSTEAGKQILIYEVVDDPSVFDVAWAIEQGDETHLSALTAAQNTSDDMVFEIYQRTLKAQTAQEAQNSPIHQLFYHRLAGGRLDRFYGSFSDDNSAVIHLADTPYLMREVRRVRWQINDQQYDDTLDDLILRAIDLLQPAQDSASIIGHGDAHNGNVFFRGTETPPSMLYFDPAFAGRHDPLLDLTKPLFHNVFAMWMYFPQVKADQLRIALKVQGNGWIVEHDYSIPPVRDMFLESKIERVLIPTLKILREHDQLRADWRTYLKSALFCCPFLTMNLTDSTKFPPSISLLGLSMAIEMGAESIGKRSRIDQVLDQAAAAID